MTKQTAAQPKTPDLNINAAADVYPEEEEEEETESARMNKRAINNAENIHLSSLIVCFWHTHTHTHTHRVIFIKI